MAAEALLPPPRQIAIAAPAMLVQRRGCCNRHCAQKRPDFPRQGDGSRHRWWDGREDYRTKQDAIARAAPYGFGENASPARGVLILSQKFKD